MYGLWDENALSLGRPGCMDLPTFIEWLDQQLETEVETTARHAELKKNHEEWHRTSGIISACCITGGSFSLTGSAMTMNEVRQLQESFKEGVVNHKAMVLPAGVTVTPIKE